MTYKQTELERQRMLRINVALWAYAYEVHDNPMVPDFMFDDASNEIDLEFETDRPDLDKWFKENFVPCTGMWVHKHPELDKIKSLYVRLAQMKTCGECGVTIQRSR